MSDTVKIRTRLHLPEARVGSVLEVSRERAARLVNAKYAVYVETDEPADLVLADPLPQAADSPAGVVSTSLPAADAVKAEWVEFAEAIGVPTVDDEGTALTKVNLIKAVTEAVAE